MNKKIALIALRMIVSLFFIAEGLSVLGFHFYTSSEDKVQHWITHFPVYKEVMAVLFLIVGALFISGFKLKATAFSGAVLITINHLVFLFQNSFYNYTEITLPLLFCCCALFWAFSENSSFLENKITVKPSYLLYFLLRVFLGSVMFAQGIRIVLLSKKSISEYVFLNYVTPYEHSFLPKFSLVTMGYLNPFILLIGGLLILIGYQTKFALYVVSFFFISLIFGHLIENPHFGENMYASGTLGLISVGLLYFERLKVIPQYNSKI